RVAIGELGIDTAGEIGPRNELLQAIGRDLAAGIDLVERVMTRLPALESVNALKPQQLRRTTELQDGEDAGLRVIEERVAVDDRIAIDGRRLAQRRTSDPPGRNDGQDEKAQDDPKPHRATLEHRGGAAQACQRAKKMPGRDFLPAGRIAVR